MEWPARPPLEWGWGCVSDEQLPTLEYIALDSVLDVLIGLDHYPNMALDPTFWFLFLPLIYYSRNRKFVDQVSSLE